MYLEEIKLRIEQEICRDTLREISDESLMPKYVQNKSFQKERAEFQTKLDKYVTDEEAKKKFMEEQMPKMIKAGLKGNIRGKKFNEIIKDRIMKLNLDSERFEVCFEKNCISHSTSEIPDWYILEKSTNKVLIGMNQLDLWNGGGQSNRSSKYIYNTVDNTVNCKLLCVICNEPQLTEKNKQYELFQTGFQNNTLCYPNNLEKIITLFFCTH